MSGTLLEWRDQLRHLLDTIKEATGRIRQFNNRRMGEQNTKASLVEPVLQALGWDIRDPDEVHREFRPTGRDSPVDYALKLLRKPRLFVEAKGLGETLSDRRWVTQMLVYASVAGVEWCVLTDGNEYRFYNASAPVDADDKLFHRIRLLDDAPHQCAQAMNLLSRANLEENLLEVMWTTHYVDRRTKDALLDIVAPPSKEIIQLIRNRVPKLSAKEIAQSLRRLEVNVQVPSVLPEKRGQRVARSTPPRKQSPKGSQGRKAAQGISLVDLIEARLISPQAQLFGKFKGQVVRGVVQANGEVLVSGTSYPSCSAAAEAAQRAVGASNPSTNGWDFWQLELPDGMATLGHVRDKFRESRPDTPRLRLAGSHRGETPAKSRSA